MFLRYSELTYKQWQLLQIARIPLPFRDHSKSVFASDIWQQNTSAHTHTHKSKHIITQVHAHLCRLCQSRVHYPYRTHKYYHSAAYSDVNRVCTLHTERRRCRRQRRHCRPGNHSLSTSKHDKNITKMSSHQMRSGALHAQNTSTCLADNVCLPFGHINNRRRTVR